MRALTNDGITIRPLNEAGRKMDLPPFLSDTGVIAIEGELAFLKANGVTVLPPKTSHKFEETQDFLVLPADEEIKAGRGMLVNAAAAPVPAFRVEIDKKTRILLKSAKYSTALPSVLLLSLISIAVLFGVTLADLRTGTLETRTLPGALEIREALKSDEMSNHADNSDEDSGGEFFSKLQDYMKSERQ